MQIQYTKNLIPKMKKWEDNTTCPFFIINKGQTNFDDLKFILVSDA